MVLDFRQTVCTEKAHVDITSALIVAFVTQRYETQHIKEMCPFLFETTISLLRKHFPAHSTELEDMMPDSDASSSASFEECTITVGRYLDSVT